MILRYILIAIWCSPGIIWSQTSPYIFSLVKDNVKGMTENQCATGTCWSFATTSFLESEVYRKSGVMVDLSEMYNVRKSYPRKAECYIRYQGKHQFGPGGLSHDVMEVVREYGLVPESAYSGLLSGTLEYDHGTLDASLSALVNAIVEQKLNAEDQNWKKAVDRILDTYIGEDITEFGYNGKAYTPASFRETLGINPDEYIGLTSFIHHPFYRPMVVEVPDNWASGSYMNIPMTELLQIMEYAINSGFTVAWDADVSEQGFSFSSGLAILPDDSVEGSSYFRSYVTERSFDPALRQEMFDTYETTDDHLMHITGMVTDQKGARYFITKNSWGSNNPFGGMQYVSIPYFSYKTICIYLHRDAIPPALRKKMGVQ